MLAVPEWQQPTWGLQAASGTHSAGCGLHPGLTRCRAQSSSSLLPLCPPSHRGRFDAAEFPTNFAAQIRGFDIEGLVDKKNARRYDDCLSYAMVASKKASSAGCWGGRRRRAEGWLGCLERRAVKEEPTRGGRAPTHRMG